VSPMEEPEVWSAALLWSLWLVLAGIASLACYSPARRVEEWAATHLGEKEGGTARKYRRSLIRARLDRSAKASTQALWLALFCFGFAFLSAFSRMGTVGADELLWTYLDAIWLATFAALACFAPPIATEGGSLKGRPHEDRLIQTHLIPLSVLLFVAFGFDRDGLPPFYRLIYVAPGLRLLWHYLSHKTIPRRALAITLLVGATLVYSAVVWRAWQSSPFA
jgi:hypothetical protein